MAGAIFVAVVIRVIANVESVWTAGRAAADIRNLASRLALLLAIRQNNAIVMLGVLQVVLSKHGISG